MTPQPCRVIIAAFAEGQRPELSSLVSAKLVELGLCISRIEIAPKGLLVFAEAFDCDSLNLLKLRQQLIDFGQPQGVEFRLQREELFRAMHILSTPVAPG